MSVPVVPYITPLTFDPGELTPHHGVPNYGFGVIDIFNTATFFDYSLQSLFPRKILYFAATSNQNIHFDVRLKLNDGSEIFPWQARPSGGTAARSIGTDKFPLRWGSEYTTDAAGSASTIRALAPNSVTQTMSKGNNNLRFTCFSGGLYFITAATQLTVEPRWPTPAFTPAAGGSGNYNQIILLKILEFPLGIKLHSKLYR